MGSDKDRARWTRYRKSAKGKAAQARQARRRRGTRNAYQMRYMHGMTPEDRLRRMADNLTVAKAAAAARIASKATQESLFDEIAV